MPRRKSKAAKSKRPQPKLPVKVEGRDDASTRRDNLELTLKDFDVQVQQKIEEMHAEGSKIKDQIKAMFRIEYCRIPKQLKKLKMSEYLNTNGPIFQIAREETDKVITEMSNTITAKITNTQSGKRPALTSSSQSDEDMSGTITKAKPRRIRKTVNNANTSKNMPAPASTRKLRQTLRSKQNQFETPGFGMNRMGAHGCETPLFTPKFDPRLPITPAMKRQPKPGERTIHMSLAGSPLSEKSNRNTAAPKNEIILTIPNTNQTLQISPDTDLDNFDIPELDDTFKQQLSKLQEGLIKMMQATNSST